MQLLAYERHLPEQGVSVTRFDPWAPQFGSCDLVHFFSCIGGSSHFCAFVKRLGLPLVVSSSLWITEATKSQFPVAEIAHQLHLADRIVTNSVMESDTLAKVLGLARERFVEVPNAIDDRFLVSADAQRFRQAFGLDRPFVLCVANIEPRKNQLGLVRAMLGHPELDLVLVGNIRDAGYWAEVQAAAGPQLRYVGVLDPNSELLVSAYAGCSVFALPSLFETPGLAALEAIAQGAPVVITSEGSTREYLGTHAYYVDPLSVSAIEEAVARALQSPRSNAYRPETWSGAVARLADVYRAVLAAGTGLHD
jgi:glycosyltransferase involved in cell wall biosynthesis